MVRSFVGPLGCARGSWRTQLTLVTFLFCMQAGRGGPELSQDELAQLISLGVTRSCMKGVTILSVKEDGLADDRMGPPPLGKIVFANATFEEMCGRSADQLQGSSLDILIGPDSDPVQVPLFRWA